MDFYFLLGYRQFGLKEIRIRVKYLLKKRLINLTTDIVAVAINLLDGKDINNHWSLLFLVPNKHSYSQSFILLIQSFIRDVFITDSVLNSICTFNLIKFQNKFKDHDISQEENTKFDNLRRRMFLMGITIIEHEDLCFYGAISKEEPDLAMFRYKNEDEELLMKMQVPESVFWTFNLNDIFLITFIIFMCRFSKVMSSSSRTESISKSSSIIITDPSTTTKAALSNLWLFQIKKTDVRDEEKRVLQAANSAIVTNEDQTRGEFDIR